MSSQTQRLRLFFQKGFFQELPEPFFAKMLKNTHMSILSQGTDTVDKKLAVFTYVCFFVTEAQKSSKNKNNQSQLKNFTGSYIKKAYIIRR